MAEFVNRNSHEILFGNEVGSFLSRKRKQLEALVGSPPSANNVTPDFWVALEMEANALLIPILTALFIQSSVEHLVDTKVAPMLLVDAEEKAETLAGPWVNRRAGELAAKLSANLRDDLSKRSAEWAVSLEQNQPITKAKVRDDLLDVAGPDRAARIVTTETTNAGASAAEIVMNETGRNSPDDLWVTRSHLSRTGPCPICEPLNKTPRAVWSQDHPEGPPAHPNCVCEIDYAAEPGPNTPRSKVTSATLATFQKVRGILQGDDSQ